MSSKAFDRATLFSDCEFFIDYRSSQTGLDRSDRLGDELQRKYGAHVVRHPDPSTTTHLIFKNGNDETVSFARTYKVPLIDPMWLEHSIRKKRLVSIDKYLVAYDENQHWKDEIHFERLTISNQNSKIPSTPGNQVQIDGDRKLHSEKKKKKLYTPNRIDFEQENSNQSVHKEPRVITLDNLGIKLSDDDDHQKINRYGCSIVRRGRNENIIQKTECQNDCAEKSLAESIPSQSQSSPTVHFTATKGYSAPSIPPMFLSPATITDFDSQQQLAAFSHRPQSTPKLLVNVARGTPQHTSDNYKMNLIEEKDMTPLKTVDYSSFTKVTPFPTRDPIEQIVETQEDNGDVFLDAQEIVEEPQPQIKVTEETNLIPRAPPILALTQAMQKKKPQQIAEKQIVSLLTTKTDLPVCPANYALVFYQFKPLQYEEAKKLVRRMGDCFLSDNIDMTTTHIIISDDSSDIFISLEFILGLIYGCRFVTFDWLKSSSRVGEWLHSNKFEPKILFQSHPSLNLYRKFRQQQKPIQLFNHCGTIYLTSLVKERQLLLKLLTLLGANITINRNLAKILVGLSSKTHGIEIYPQVTEQWAIDSILSGDCLPVENYLIENVS